MNNFFGVFGTVFCEIGGVLLAVILICTLATLAGNAVKRCYYRWYHVKKDLMLIWAFRAHQEEFVKWCKENGIMKK